MLIWMGCIGVVSVRTRNSRATRPQYDSDAATVTHRILFRSAVVISNIAVLGDRRQRTLAIAHRLSVGHDIGVATSTIDLATHPNLRLTRWWFAARCARLFAGRTAMTPSSVT
jgi:hypothetical protein